MHLRILSPPGRPHKQGLDQMRHQVHVTQTLPISNRVTHHWVPHGGLQREALRFHFRLPPQHPHNHSELKKGGARWWQWRKNKKWKRNDERTITRYPCVFFPPPANVVGQSLETLRPGYCGDACCSVTMETPGLDAARGAQVSRFTASRADTI